MLWNEASTKMGRDDAPTRFLRREWKHNKPHLQKSISAPTLSLLPTTRPHFTCQQCGFINTQIPICLWCCWSSKEAEIGFEKSMPRPRRVSAPMRVQSPAERRTKEPTGARYHCVNDAVGVSFTCQNDKPAGHSQDQGASRHTQDSPGFSRAEEAESTNWGSIRLAISGGPRRNSQIRCDHEVNQTSGAQTWRGPGLPETNKYGNPFRVIGDDADTEVDMYPCMVGSGEVRDRVNLTQKGKSKQDPMSNLQSLMTPTAKRPGMRTFGDVSNSVLVCRMFQFIFFIHRFYPAPGLYHDLPKKGPVLIAFLCLVL
ncbi:hypothetical protein AX15_006702 [Amanita polypyramis BW_CC]|nr:hypothetical protein AX15_006702 [Amanita polypyramis BW_CC]